MTAHSGDNPKGTVDLGSSADDSTGTTDSSEVSSATPAATTPPVDSAADLGTPGPSRVRIREGDPPAYTKDKLFYRRVSYMLGTVVVLCIVLGVWIYSRTPTEGTPEIPDFLIAVASTSIGALAGVFAGGGR